MSGPKTTYSQSPCTKPLKINFFKKYHSLVVERIKSNARATTLNKREAIRKLGFAIDKMYLTLIYKM